jgi:hypothetical protein
MLSKEKINYYLSVTFRHWSSDGRLIEKPGFSVW